LCLLACLARMATDLVPHTLSLLAVLWQLPGFTVLYLQRGRKQEAAREPTLDAGFVAMRDSDHVTTDVADLMQSFSAVTFGPASYEASASPNSPRESLSPGSFTTNPFLPGSFTPSSPTSGADFIPLRHVARTTK
jgi:hypothetical protein